MTIVRTGNSNLALISPVPMTEAEVRQLNDLGEVRWLISPNGLHHLHLGTVQKIFPRAEIWGPEKSRHKRGDLFFTGVLSEEHAVPWSADLELVCVKAGPSLGEEFLFFHPESRTLVMTDFMFNIREPGGWLARTMMTLNGAMGKFTMTRLGKMVFKDRSQIRRALEKIREWDPRIAVMAHGEPVDERARERIMDSFTWLK